MLQKEENKSTAEETTVLMTNAGRILEIIPGFELPLARLVLFNPEIRNRFAPTFQSEQFNLQQSFELYDRLVATECFQQAFATMLKGRFSGTDPATMEHQFRDRVENCPEANATLEDLLSEIAEGKWDEEPP